MSILPAVPRALLLLAAVAAPTFAQGAAPSTPVRVPTPGGAAIAVDSAQFRFQYGSWHYAPARVEGNLVFVSGIVAGAWGRDSVLQTVPQLEAAFREAWKEVRAVLEAAGSSTADIVDLTTFHVFQTPSFLGTKREHIEAFRRVKDEFVPAPYPSWTGIGVATLFPDRGLVEIRVVARKR